MRRPNHASRFEGIAKNEIASFQGLRHGNLAISSHQSRQKTTLAQWVRSSSRATVYVPRGAAKDPIQARTIGNQAAREQRTHDATLVTATRLQADRRDRAAAQPLDQIGPTRPVVTHRRALLLGQHDDVQTILGDINSAKREHLRIPSLLMRARAQATVRVWKKRLELQAHS